MRKEIKPETKKVAALFLVLLALSFALRLFRISQGLWYDELFNVNFYVTGSWKTILTDMAVPNNHILYTLLAKLSRNFFGEKEWSLRLPSLVMGGLTAPVFYLFCRGRVGDRVAFVSGLFMALNYWMVCIGQDARGYSGMILFGGLSQFLFLDWLEKKRRNALSWYLACTMIGCYFHLHTLFIPAGQAIFGFGSWVAKRKERKPSLFLVPCLAAVLSMSLYIPVAGQFLQYAKTKGHALASQWLNLDFLGGCLELLSGSHVLWVGVVCCLLAGYGLWRLFKVWPNLCLAYLSPVVLLLFASYVFRVAIYTRFLSFEIPFFSLCLAVGIDQASGVFQKKPGALKNYLALAMIAAVLILMSFSLVRYYRVGKQEGYKEAALYIREKYPSKTVYSHNNSAEVFYYYLPSAKALPSITMLARTNGVGFLSGSVLVTSSPLNWSPEDAQIISERCQLQKEWPSALYKHMEVSLYFCY